MTPEPDLLLLAVAGVSVLCSGTAAVLYALVSHPDDPRRRAAFGLSLVGGLVLAAAVTLGAVVLVFVLLFGVLMAEAASPGSTSDFWPALGRVLTDPKPVAMVLANVAAWVSAVRYRSRAPRVPASPAQPSAYPPPTGPPAP